MNNKNLRPFKLFVLKNFPFIEADFDAITNYELLCKIVEYLNNVIASQNETMENFQELATQFNNLYNYVHDYFDNLDVQDEINNKLDEMVEQGTLQEIVADYLNSKAIFGFDTVSNMVSSTNLINGSFARTLGYNTKNDGGAGLYKIRTITNDDVVDNGLIIGMNNNTLIAELILENDSVSPSQFGAIGDGTTDDTIYIQKAIDSGKNIKLTANYGFSHIEFDFNRYNFEGNYHSLNYVGDGTEGEAILFMGKYTKINNLRIANTTSHTIPCLRYRSKNSSSYAQFNNFNNIRIENFELAIFYGISTTESINCPQSENYITNFKTRGVHRVLYGNQPNGHLFFSDSILMASHNEEQYIYDATSSCIMENVEGAIHIDNCVLLNTADSQGTGFKGKYFMISDCNYEVAGTTFNINGYCNIDGLNGGFKGNSEVDFMIVNPDTDNSAYLVRLNNIDISVHSNVANRSLIVNNNSNAFVLIENTKINGLLFNTSKALSQCYGNIINCYRNNVKLLNFNSTIIDKDNYLNYLEITRGSMSVDGDEVVLTAPTGGLSIRIKGTFDQILELVSDIRVVTGSAKFQGNITLADGTTSSVSKDFTTNNLTSLFRDQSSGYKYDIGIYGTTDNIEVRFKKIQVRGNKMISTQHLS